jgi:excisionase family DNA binding protein
MARIAKQLLSRYVHEDQPLTVHVMDSDHEALLELPAGAVTLLLAILEGMAAGQEMALIANEAELTTLQAAEMLHVSCSFLSKLLDEGQLPYRQVGSHRRIHLDDVMNYKQAIDQKRIVVLDQLVAEAQHQAMGYD